MEPIILESGVELRPIPVSPSGNYMAGSDGKIYSRTRYKGFGRKDYVSWYALTGCKGKKKGYLSVSLCHENKRVTKSVHRLVCMAFHGLPSPSSLQVRHLDGNPENNTPVNLTWGTQIENWQDRRAHGNGMEWEKHHQSKLTNIERSHLKWAIEKGLCSQKHAARCLGMSQAAIQRIVSLYEGEKE